MVVVFFLCSGDQMDERMSTTGLPPTTKKVKLLVPTAGVVV